MDNKKKPGMELGNGMKAQVLEQIPTPVMTVDTDLKVTYMNTASRNFLGKSWEEIKGKFCYDLFGSSHCKTTDCNMLHAIETGEKCSSRNMVTLEGRTIHFEYYAVPLKDESGNIVGGLEFIVDITERVRDEERLREQSRTIREISTPAIKLWEGIVVLPVVGVVDSMRAQQMMDTMLLKIAETGSKFIILDIQGVAAVDTAVANHLIKITKATKLMGCQCIISGISPAVAQTLVHLGIDMGEVKTNSTLSDALADAFVMMKLEVRKIKSAERS
jgi:rsbT co-antagonist protein RsbR